MRLPKLLFFLILFLSALFNSRHGMTYDKVTTERYLERYWDKNGPNGYNSPPFEDYSGSEDLGDVGAESA